MARLLLVVVAILAVSLWFASTNRYGDGVEPVGNTAVPRGTDDLPETQEIAIPNGASLKRELQGAGSPSAGSAADEAAELDVEGAMISGRVIDDARRPVAAVVVHLFAGAGPSIRATTDQSGRFVMAGVAPLPKGLYQAFLHAIAPDGRGAIGVCSVPPGAGGESRAADLVLEPAHSVVAIVSESGEPIAGAAVTIDVGFGRLRAGRAVTDATGSARFEAVPFGSVKASARHGDLIGQTILSADVMREGAALTVELAPARSVTITITQPDSGEPVEGAHVVFTERVMPSQTHVSGNDPFMMVSRKRPVDHALAVTGPDGRVVVDGLPHRRLRLEASHPRDAGRYETRRYVEVDEESVALEMPLGRVIDTVRWNIFIGEAGAPPDGVELALVPAIGTFETVPVDWPETAHVEGGDVVIRQVPSGGTVRFRVNAMAPDGTIGFLFLQRGETTGRTVEFKRPREIVVHVTTADGDPAPGWAARAYNQGNNPVGEPAVTSAEGDARLTGLTGRLVDVRVLPVGQPFGGWKAGSVDLTQGGGEIDFVLPRDYEIPLRITVDGVRRLPAHLKLRPGKIVSEDPDAATVVVRFSLPEGQDSLQTFLTSLRDILAAPLELTRAQLEAGAPVDVALATAGSILVEVKRPAGTKVKLLAEAEQEDGTWKRMTRMAADYPNADDGRFRLPSLAPGRHRVRDMVSGSITEAIDVDPARGEQLVVLDLTRSGLVGGHVTGPDGADLSLARVVVVGAGSEIESSAWRFPRGAPRNSVGVGADGSFRLSASLDETRLLRVWHPVLRAAADGGETVVDGLRDDIELVLSEGPTCSWTLPETGEGERLQHRVLLLDPAIQASSTTGEIAAAIISEHAVVVADGRATFGGYSAGTYSIWIDTESSYAPLVLSGIELDDGATALGAPSFGRGSTLRFRVLVPDGTSPPRIVPGARSVAKGLDGNALCGRLLNSRGEAEVVFSGFGPGTYVVECLMFDRATPFEAREITLDGVHDEVIDIDLRLR